MTFGYYDKDKYTGDLHWFPVTHKQHWTIKLDDVKVGGKSTNLCAKGDCHVIIDSGFSALAFPPNMYNRFIELGYPTKSKPVKCITNSESVGDLTYTIGGIDFTMRSENWLLSERPKI